MKKIQKFATLIDFIVSIIKKIVIELMIGSETDENIWEDEIIVTEKDSYELNFLHWKTVIL